LEQHIRSIIESYRRTGHLGGAVAQIKDYLPGRNRKMIAEVLNEFLTIPDGRTYAEHLDSCVARIVAEPRPLSDRKKKMKTKAR